MKIKIVYPIPPKTSDRRRRLLSFFRVPVYVGGLCSVIVNLCVGGKAWSVIVLIGLYMLWTLLLSPAVVECNRISLWIRLIASSCVLLACIDVFLAPGLITHVVPVGLFWGCGGLQCAVFYRFDTAAAKCFSVYFLLTTVLSCFKCRSAV